MPRTIVYDRSTSFDGDERFQAGPSGSAPPDRYGDKLIKYIPGEVLSGFLPLAALANSDAFLVVLIVVGLLATPGYLWLRAQQKPEAERPLWHFYVLATVAFAAWAVGASAAVSELLHIDAGLAAGVLGLAVFVLPLLDGIGEEILR